MSETQQLTAADGHSFGAYVARPEGKPLAGLVVIQEIFGVNRHIRSVADGYANDGFLAVALAIFDRYERNLELSYEGEDLQKAFSFINRLDKDKAIEDVQAAIDYAANESGGKVGVIGYCLGGLLAWLSATRLNAAAAVGYYPGSIGHFVNETPKVPVLLNFGAEDSHIPVESIEAVHAAHPEVTIYRYEGAGHAFNCNPRSSYNAAAAALARERSLAFLKKNLEG